MKKNHLVLAISLSLSALMLSSAAFAQKPNKKLIERGKWLVGFAGCDDCHTPKVFGPKGPEFDMTKRLSGAPAHVPIPDIPKNVVGPTKWGALVSNDLTTWAGPWGVSFTANLTPDIETGTGSWNAATFVKIFRTGKHLGEGRDILPPMPWKVIGSLSDADLKAIFAFLQSLPPIKNAVPEPIPPAMEEKK
jgi:cytochrome c553